MKVAINLLPEDLRPKRQLLQLPNWPPQVIGGVVLTLFLAVYGMMVLTVQLKQREYQSLSNRLAMLQPKSYELNKLKVDLDEMTAKAKSLESLGLGDSPWSARLTQLTQLIPEEVWLTDLQAAHNESITIRGSALVKGEGAAHAVGKFVKNLKADELFSADYSQIDLESLQRRFITTIEVVDFTLLCRSKSEDELAGI